jgi:hypothetical protein
MATDTIAVKPEFYMECEAVCIKCKELFQPDDELWVDGDNDVCCESCMDVKWSRDRGYSIPVFPGPATEDKLQHACVLHASRCLDCPRPLNVAAFDPGDYRFCKKCEHLVFRGEAETQCKGCDRWQKWVLKHTGP